ncbi:flagellar protein export ATPase FliI [Sulfoacidibacillus thermotolerans]|uniref:Flagellar protein export ATPase FliI n=1 Tax=Sulfoacidibacillus thermotolerans TaxID=1765684 RepID=A0A2U3DA74_SULT2|nr:flagellar protein export ATPase FliI [Sulfoacidibacillus thermotolerans]PWI58188.1 flagellar protein export ATPase FliI [Sulfoacidibacillus thermotolerans]
MDKRLAFYRRCLADVKLHRIHGRIEKVIGLTIESRGPVARIGDVCIVKSGTGKESLCEVVGFRRDDVLLMPLGSVEGLGPGSEVRATGESLKIRVGPELLGRVVDGLGNPIDDLEPLPDREWRPLHRDPPSPLSRPRINTPLCTGVRVIDGLLTVGQGQRIGLFAGSGVGKSTLLGMIAKNSEADVNVIALIGERGREVREFIERDLGEEGRKRSVVVVATSDQPALVRVKGAFTATAIAEYFRDQGLQVALMMDSVTRFAMAQRELGLAVGEPPTARGYTPSVFNLLPKLLERAGRAKRGAITAIYTVLVDGDDLQDPIADAVRGILDGHFVLTRELANRGHFPALDPLQSVSRLMSDLVSDEHLQSAVQVRALLAAKREVEDLIRIGAYQKGTDRLADLAITVEPQLLTFLRQSRDESTDFASTLQVLQAIARGVVAE